MGVIVYHASPTLNDESILLNGLIPANPISWRPTPAGTAQVDGVGTHVSVFAFRKLARAWGLARNRPGAHTIWAITIADDHPSLQDVGDGSPMNILELEMVPPSRVSRVGRTRS